MQLNQTITCVFNQKGYQLQSTISMKQYITIMKQLSYVNYQLHSLQALNDNVKKKERLSVVESTAKQIYINALDNKKSNNSITVQSSPTKNHQHSPQVITTQQLIQSIISAIQILQNRIQQCKISISQLKTTQQLLLKQNNFSKLQQLQHKFNILSSDKEQFQNDYKYITTPFINYINKYPILKDKVSRTSSIRKASYQKNSLNKISIDPQLQRQQQKLPLAQSKFRQLQQYLQQKTQIDISQQTIQEDRRVPLWILGLLLLFQISVMIVKVSFVNLIVYLIGIFVLFQPYKQNMVKLSMIACSMSLFIDILWLLLYSSIYLQPQPNTGLTHIIKPYFQYIWFVTLLQSFIKLLYIYTLNRFHYHNLIFNQFQQMKSQQQQQQNINNQLINDHYIPNLKQFIKLTNT